MALKENINKIHIDLLHKYEDITLNEGSDLQNGNYISLIIKDSDKELNIKIKKENLELNDFDWIYKSNPNNEDSHLVERRSNINFFLDDVKDIFEKERFDSEYIKTIKE